MPTYVYACKNCGYRFEQYQSFSEDSLRACPECAQDALRKVFDSVGIVFKGPGFYSTDSSTSGSAAAAAGAATSGSTSTGDSASTGAAASTSSGSSSTSSPSTQPAPAAS
ncbi:FmdB family zinc ribbon protein [Brachybacterium vulturis]|uniref:FmdB family zinc ribbon protein n=1 Tax=Brachybacterium vulturis TaxID=2017484 RepID=UPI003735F94A